MGEAIVTGKKTRATERMISDVQAETRSPIGGGCGESRTETVTVTVTGEGNVGSQCT